jgi:hypothetical protein
LNNNRKVLRRASGAPVAFALVENGHIMASEQGVVPLFRTMAAAEAGKLALGCPFAQVGAMTQEKFDLFVARHPFHWVEDEDEDEVPDGATASP